MKQGGPSTQEIIGIVQAMVDEQAKDLAFRKTLPTSKLMSAKPLE
jgi:hypothetical protein